MFSGSLTGISSLIVYIGIVVLFVVGLVRCVFPVMRTRGLIRRAIKSIRAGGDKKYAWQEDAFLGKGALFAHWSEYLNNLFFADGVYHNASNVEDYINEETVMYGPGRASFADALPGLMKALLPGVIALVEGLGDAIAENAEAIGELAAAVLSRSFDSRYLTILHTKRAKFTFEKPIAWTRDGEAGGEHQEIELCNYHCPVQLIF